MTKPINRLGPMTKAIHAGEDRHSLIGESAPALHLSSTFISKSVEGFSAHDIKPDSPYVYSRWANPTVTMLEKKLAALHNAEACLCMASGMAAASGFLLTLLNKGDHAIFSDVCYAGIAELAHDTLPRMGINVSFVDMSHPKNVYNEIRPDTRLIHSESPVNPIGRLTNLAEISRIAKSAGALHSTDSTFTSPLGQDAIGLGVDLVLHSITKYIGGHGDALGGAIVGSTELIEKIRFEAGIHLGGILSPFNAWLIARGAATLPLRLDAHQKGALKVAQWLESQPSVTKVIYPGLPSHPQYTLAKQQMKNTSGMIAFQVGNAKRGREIAQKMMQTLNIIHYAVSLGHHRSLVFWMETEGLINTSFRLSEKQAKSYRDFAGQGVFRLSVGLENADDLITDLGQVL
ncbi:MAG: aminotransferase class I/II-fold pyridoxal phosphate-dependent enzyme [Aestuariivita sp.]|nr:aminotransferase class I/II-fold pyridoxal phosphate-dependent enzyme [Aestuariivita sp.]